MKKVFLTLAVLIALSTGLQAAPGENGTILTYRDALESGNMPMIKQIVEYGQFEDPFNGAFFSNGQTPLMLAAAKGNVKAVRYLLKKGADAGATDQSGKTALMYAQDNGHKKLYRTLRWAEGKKNKSTK